MLNHLKIAGGILSAFLVTFITITCFAAETEKAPPVVTFSSKYFNKYAGDTGVVVYDGRSSHVIGNAGFKV